MRVGEGGSAGGQLVDMRSLDHRVATKIADPVVLVVNGDEENVGLLRHAQDNRRNQNSGKK